MKTPYSMEDILRYRKAAYLALRVCGGKDEALEILATHRSPLSFFFQRMQFGELARFFAPYLPGITREDMGKIWIQFDEERDTKKKARIQKIRYRSRDFPIDTGRLWPLVPALYDRFAKYVWGKRGKPKFGSHAENLKCRWGPPIKDWTGSKDGKTVFKTVFIGCQIKVNIRGRKFLKQSIGEQ